jgi:hypothetical protein
MRLTKAIAVSAILALLFSMAGCSKNFTGIYVHDKNKKDYIELRSDGTFFLRERGVGASGKFRVDGQVLTLTFDGGPALQGKVHDDIIVDDGGESWTKGERPGDATSAKATAVNRTNLLQNESSAASAVRTLNIAEVTYVTSYPANGYAASLAIMGPGSPPIDCTAAGKIDSKHACLIDSALGCASTWCVRNGGYRFNITSTSKAPPFADYVITATPVDANTGRRNFCAMPDAVIREQTGPPLSAPVPVSECNKWPPLQ